MLFLECCNKRPNLGKPPAAITASVCNKEKRTRKKMKTRKKETELKKRKLKDKHGHRKTEKIFIGDVVVVVVFGWFDN